MLRIGLGKVLPFRRICSPAERDRESLRLIIIAAGIVAMLFYFNKMNTMGWYV